MKEHLREWADRVANEFWVTHYRHRHGEGVPKSVGVYGVRIVEWGWTISIRWYKQSIWGTKEYYRVTSKALKSPEKGKLRMSMSQFSKAQDWELEAIQKAEDEFEKIRRCAAHLKGIRTGALGFKQLVDGKPDEDIDEDEADAE